MKIIKHSVDIGICLVLIIIHLEIMVKKFLNLLNLFENIIFYIYKAIKVVIIDKNKNFIFIAF